MIRALLASFLFSLSLLLAACGGGGGAATTAVPPPVSAAGAGNVVKGLVRNGIVSAWRWREGAYVRVAAARTGGDGAFTLNIPDPVPGEVLRLQLEVSPDTSPDLRTEMLCDASQCGSATRGQWTEITSGMGLASWASIGSEGVVTIMPMTAISTLLVRHAEMLAGGHLTPDALDVARLRVAALVGLNPAQLLELPGDILNDTWVSVASPEAVRLSVLSAAIAELAAGNGQTIEQVLDLFAGRFNDRDGHLLQSGEPGSLADWLGGVGGVATASPAVMEKILEWGTALAGSLRAGELTVTACGSGCGDFDSNRLITALGTGPDMLGADLRRVMDEHGVTRLEDLIGAQLARYSWLAQADTTALAGVALNVAMAGAGSALTGSDVSLAGVTVVRDGNVQHLSGELNGFAVELDLTLPSVLQQVLFAAPGSPVVLVIGASGQVHNDRLRGRLDGSLTIDASRTDFGPLRTAVQSLLQAGSDPAASQAAQAALLDAIAGIVRAGKATFTLQGEAALARLEVVDGALAETSQLGISGRGVLNLDMNGRADGGIAADGRADYGTLVLPSGDTFTVDPRQGHALTFALGKDGTAALAIGAHVLGHSAAVSGNGRLARLGVLLDHLRDNVATMIESQVLELQPTLAQALADLSTLELSLQGQAVIPDYNHTYTLALAGGVLTLSQPNSATTALSVALLAKGALARAGDQWWLLGVDLSTPATPALTLADSGGGEWRWSVDLSGLLALQ